MNLKLKMMAFFSLLSICVGCSISEKTLQENIQLSSLDSGLLLGEEGEDGIPELVIPEMVEYTEVTEKIQNQNKLETMELGSDEPVINQGEDEISFKSSSSLLIQEEINEEFIAPAPIETQTRFVPEKEEIEEVDVAEKPKKFEEYIVQKNDTLMLIAYKLYQDFNKWKEIASLNQDRLRGRLRLTEGQ